MRLVQQQNPDGFLDEAQLAGAVRSFCDANDYTGKRILLLIPDNTRSGPAGEVFKAIWDCLKDRAESVDVLAALGTHQPMSEEQFCARLDISGDQRRTTYSKVAFFNHEWDKPETFVSVGSISAGEIDALSEGLFSEAIEVRVNRLIFDYDVFFIIGPVFPHEVVGFSGGHKYIFPGIAGQEIIDFFHWLGAVITNPRIDGHLDTPTRRVVEKAASMIKVPHKLFALVADGSRAKGIFIGDCVQAWRKAAELSAQVHIVYKDRSFDTVLGVAPEMYEDIWTAGKVMYKLEPIVADGGTLIIYAPHITEISYTHGKVIDRIGYHTRDYFLKRMDQFKDVPGGVMAHSTHVKGIGTWEDGVERPRINVILATGIDQERCEKVNLGYLDPRQVNPEDYANKEDRGILLVREAGERLYRLKSGEVPTIPVPSGGR